MKLTLDELDTIWYALNELQWAHTKRGNKSASVKDALKDDLAMTTDLVERFDKLREEIRRNMTATIETDKPTECK